MKYATQTLIVGVILTAAAPVWAADAQPNIPPASIAAPAANPDPYEPYNRVMFKVNDTADRYVLSPVARGYRKVAPKPVRIGVTNFFNNLRDVVSFGSNVLRLDIKRASEDFMRVAVNTTFGLGGLINIADAGQMPDNKNSLGDTLATWGWKNSNYFVYPLTGPSTVRDSVGSTVFLFYPVQNAIFEKTAGRVAATVVNGVNTREGLLDLTDSLDDAALDKYAYTRDMYMRLRAQQLGQTPPQTAAEEEIDIDDLVDSGEASAVAPAQQVPQAGESALPEETAAELSEAPASAASE